jgi:hypothetical protein
MAADVLREQFTQISNAALRDERLSFKARGVLAWLASHQDGFGCSVAAIQAASSSDGRESIRSALKELQEFGYLEIERTRDPETGRLGPADYLVTDLPVSGDPTSGNPFLGVTCDDTAFPLVRPTNGFPDDGKSPTKNTTPKKTRENTTPPADISTSSSPSVTRGSDDDGWTAEQKHEVLCAVIAIRPEWHTPGIEAQLRQVTHLPYAQVRDAFVAAAEDRSVYSPIRLASAAMEIAVDEAAKEASAARRERNNQALRAEIAEDRRHRADPETRKARAAEARELMNARKRAG